jgi:hypothetical protein
MMSRLLPEKAFAIAGNVKALVYSAIVLAVVIIAFGIWVGTSGGSSGYKTSTINSVLGQQTIRTKGSSAQMCSDGKWVRVVKHGTQISIPGGTKLSIGGASCSNSSGGGAPLIAELILIIAAVLELVTLGLLVMAKKPRIVVKTSKEAGA